MVLTAGCNRQTARTPCPFRPADNSPFSRHLTLADLLCIFGGYCTIPGEVCKEENEKIAPEVLPYLAYPSAGEDIPVKADGERRVS